MRLGRWYNDDTERPSLSAQRRAGSRRRPSEDWPPDASSSTGALPQRRVYSSPFYLAQLRDEIERLLPQITEGRHGMTRQERKRTLDYMARRRLSQRDNWEPEWRSWMLDP